MEKKSLRYLAGGAGVGAVNGLFGGGGGMIAVPVLEGAGFSTLRAHAPAIAVILPACIVSGIVYFLGGFAPLNVLLPVAIGVALGGALGAKLLPVLPERFVNLLFGVLMLAAGARMLFP